ncbi:restriction endonuclease subunit S [Salinibacter ruber]|uniref:restriction endonuclease subunit S n=1 Tax=Salinibacter ruber TaxID=146919 RepID=UPI0020746760|nr:restriction endonuclease subunit S [Salinibacter ruber]
MSEDPDFDMEVVEDDELDSYAPSDSSTEADVSTGGELEQEQPIGQERPKTQTADSGTVKLGPKELSIPSVWNITTFEEANESEKPIGYGVVKPGPHIENGIPLIRITDVVDGRLEVGQDFHRISDELDEQYSRSRLDGGELLVSIQGTVGEVVVAPSELDGANISRTLARITPGEGLNTYWVKYFLGSKEAQDYIEVVSSGSTRASYNIGDIRKTKLPVPPLPEQRKIASVLQAIDQAIQKIDEVVETLKNVLSGARKDLFENGIDGGPTKDTPMGRFPERWELKQMGDIGKLLNGNAFPKEYQGSPYGKYPFVKVGDTNNYRKYVRGAKNYISEQELKEIGCRVQPKGTVIMPKRGAAIMTNKRRIIAQPSIIDNNQIGVVGKSVKSSFLYNYLSTVDMGRFVQEGAVKSLTKSLISKIRVPVPEKDEQEKIVNIIDSIEESIKLEEEKKEVYITVKRGLMQDLLTGNVRTVDKAIEVLDEVAVHG